MSKRCVVMTEIHQTYSQRQLSGSVGCALCEKKWGQQACIAVDLRGEPLARRYSTDRPVMWNPDSHQLSFHNPILLR